MALKDMASEYRGSASKLKEWLDLHPVENAESYDDIQRINSVKEMYRDSRSIARYLDLYYDGDRTKSGFDREIRITVSRVKNDYS